MNASRFMDKQIMDLSLSSQFFDDDNNNNKNPDDFIDLMNPKSQQQDLEFNNNKQDILPNYDFQPLHNHSNFPNSSPLRSYASLDRVETDNIAVEKPQKVNDSTVLFEIDRTMRKHTDTLMHAIDSLSARLSQMEGRTRHLEDSVNDLRVSVGNNYGSADGKLRHLENILQEVKTGVVNLKDKQEVFEGHLQLAKLRTTNPDQSSQLPNSDQHPVQQAPSASAPPQQSEFQQFPITVSLPLSSTASPHTFPFSQHNNHSPLPLGAHLDSYLPPPTQTPDTSNQYLPPPVQNQQPPPPALQPQQYHPGPTPPYPQAPQPPQQQHPSIVGVNTPQFQPSLGPVSHRSEDSSYAPRQTYPPNRYQPASQDSQPISGPPQYGSPSSVYEPPPPHARSSSSYPSSYGPPSGPTESFPYGGPTTHYGGGIPVKPQPHSPKGGTGNYPQLPTARVLPQAIPTASGVGSGSSSGGGGNKVPIDDVVDKVTNMGFSRDQVQATVRRLTENGQSVDLNIVLDKLMNDADVQPPRGWFGR